MFQHEVKNIYIGEYKWYEYSYDFRNKTKAEAESDGWVFDSATYWFSSNGISNTSGGVWYIRYTVDISSYKTLKLSWTGTVSGTYAGISLIWWTTSVWFVNWLYRPNWLWVFYNDANHYVGSALWYWDFSWEIEIDLDTWNLTSSCSNWQTIAGTLNSSYLSALKQNNTTLWIWFNDTGWYIQTFKAQAIPA